MTAVTRVAHVAGYDVRFRESGSGPDAVILVHGIGVSWRYFGPLFDELSGTTRVIAPDLPGFGRSPDPHPVLTVEEHARVVAALITGCGLDRPVVLGHSMGAQVVAELAAQQPGLVERVVLAGPVVDPAARSVPRQAWRLLRDYRRESLAVNLITLTDWLRAGPIRYARTLPTMLAYPLEDRVAAIVDPLVLVRGQHDPVCPRPYLNLLAARSVAASVVEVPGEGHVAMYRRPKDVAAACRGALLW